MTRCPVLPHSLAILGSFVIGLVLAVRCPTYSVSCGSLHATECQHQCPQPMSDARTVNKYRDCLDHPLHRQGTREEVYTNFCSRHKRLDDASGYVVGTTGTALISGRVGAADYRCSGSLSLWGDPTDRWRHSLETVAAKRSRGRPIRRLVRTRHAQHRVRLRLCLSGTGRATFGSPTIATPM